MQQKISKDTPLAEIVLRRYEKPYDLSDRELVKKVCLGLGLLQPGDSRDIIVDIFLILLYSKKSHKLLSSKEIEEAVVKYRQENNFSLVGVSSPNIRRQLKRLKDSFFVENIDNGYRICEFENLKKLFELKVEDFYLKNIIIRLKEYLHEVDCKFNFVKK